MSNQNQYKPQHGDRVSVLTLEGKMYGTIFKNSEYPEVSEWCIKYDDGECCAVLDLNYVFFESRAELLE